MEKVFAQAGMPNEWRENARVAKRVEKHESAGIALRQRLRIVKIIDGRQTQHKNICGSTTDKRMNDSLVSSRRVME